MIGKNAIIIDLCYGVDISDTFPDMIANGALDGAIFRVGEGLNNNTYPIDQITKQVQSCENNHIPYALYYAIHPWYPAEAQVDRFLNNLQGAYPAAYWLDFELYGNETAQQRSDLYHHAFTYLKSKLPENTVVGIYSGEWFIEEWAPQMKEWINEGPYWDANYYPPFAPQSWDQFKAQVLTFYLPAYSAEYPTARMWQFSGDLKTPMVQNGKTKVDYSLINTDQAPGLFEHLFKFQNYPPINPWRIIPPQAYQVIADDLRVYTSTGDCFELTDEILHAPQHIVVMKINDAGNWGEFKPDKWCNISPQNCQPID